MMFQRGLRSAIRVKPQTLRFNSSIVFGSNTHVDFVERRLTNLFDTYGSSDYIGEPINITQHSVQAMMIAKNAGESPEIQLAALLHDVLRHRSIFLSNYSV